MRMNGMDGFISYNQSIMNLLGTYNSNINKTTHLVPSYHKIKIDYFTLALSQYRNLVILK
jgi:hypothetical protein